MLANPPRDLWLSLGSDANRHLFFFFFFSHAASRASRLDTGQIPWQTPTDVILRTRNPEYRRCSPNNREAWEDRGLGIERTVVGDGFEVRSPLSPCWLFHEAAEASTCCAGRFTSSCRLVSHLPSSLLIIFFIQF